MDTREQFIQKQTHRKGFWSVKDKDGQKNFDKAVKQAEKDYDTYLTSQDEGGTEKLEKVNGILRKELEDFQEGDLVKNKSVIDENEGLKKKLKDSESLQKEKDKLGIDIDTLKTDSESLVVEYNGLKTLHEAQSQKHDEITTGYNKQVKELGETITKLNLQIKDIKKK